MAERTSTKVRRFCEQNGITIPVGFDRHPASRYVIVEQSNPPKLIARSWFNQADVIYYLERLAGDTPKRILDFKEQEELLFDGGKRLKRVGKFDVA
ncbi:MAG: hypothetical protein RIC85_02395 [Gammaproteobacteria bacterium]